jgi:hypothetical protein
MIPQTLYKPLLSPGPALSEENGFTDKLVISRSASLLFITLPFEEQTKQHVIMLFLFRAIGFFEAAEQLGTSDLRLRFRPSLRFQPHLSQRFLLGGKRGFFEVLCDRCCGICDVTFLLHVSLL